MIAKFLCLLSGHSWHATVEIGPYGPYVRDYCIFCGKKNTIANMYLETEDIEAYQKLAEERNDRYKETEAKRTSFVLLLTYLYQISWAIWMIARSLNKALFEDGLNFVWSVLLIMASLTFITYSLMLQRYFDRVSRVYSFEPDITVTAEQFCETVIKRRKFLCFAPRKTVNSLGVTQTRV